jgi:hypothetical protein
VALRDCASARFRDRRLHVGLVVLCAADLDHAAITGRRALLLLLPLIARGLVLLR